MKKQILTLPEPAHAPSNEQWAEVKQLFFELTNAGRKMILMGVKCLKIKAALPYGAFNRELATQLPEISRRSLYRAMRATGNVMEVLSCASVAQLELPGALMESLNQLEVALEGRGEPELLAEIDALIHGKSGSQLVLQVLPDQVATLPGKEGEYEAMCLAHFEIDDQGAEDETRYRMAVEAGEMTWAQCWQFISGKTTQEDGRSPIDVRKLLLSGLVRLKQWGSEAQWEKLAKPDQAIILEELDAALASLHPSIRKHAAARLSAKTAK